MGSDTKKGKRRVDRILDPAYLTGLGDVPVDRLRAMRDECEEEETILSYERRLLHARLDIINAEFERRSSGAPARSLIERLPEILSSDEPGEHRGAFPNLEPPPVFDNPRRRVEKLVSDDTLARLPDLSEAEIRAIAATIEEAERETSEGRRAVHDVLDRVIEELGRRLTPA